MNIQQAERPAPFDNVPMFVQFFTLLGLFLVSLVGFTLLGMVLATALTGVTASQLSGMGNLTDHNVILALKIMQIVSSFGGFIVPALVFSLLASRNRMDYLHLNRMGKLSVLLLGGLLMLCAMPLINYLGELNSHLKLPASMQDIYNWMKEKEDEAGQLTNAFMDHQSVKGLLLNLFMIGFLAALAEELFFRATLQQMMIKATKNVHVGVWLTGILFSAIHFEFFGFIPRMLMGVYLGYLFVWSGSIWVSVFAHFMNNATVVFLTYLEEKKALPDKFDQLGTDSSQMVYTIISIVLVTLLLVIIYKISRKRPIVVN